MNDNPKTGTEIVTVEDRRREISVQHGRGVSFRNIQEMVEAAKLMSTAGIAVRDHLRDKPGACLAVIMQAHEWEMSPFAVANKSYAVNDQLAYEAQLIHAVILKRSPIKGRPKIKFSGEGQGRKVGVWGELNDDSGEILALESPPISQINPKHSPLWKSDPDQQLSYYGVRAWARRHFPDIILGVYAPDEVPERIDTNFNPLAAVAHEGQIIEHEEAEHVDTQSEGPPAEDSVATVDDGGGDPAPAPARKKRAPKPKKEAEAPAEAQARPEDQPLAGESDEAAFDTGDASAGQEPDEVSTTEPSPLEALQKALADTKDINALKALWRTKWKSVCVEMSQKGSNDVAQQIAKQFQNRREELEAAASQPKGGETKEETQPDPPAESPPFQQQAGEASHDPQPGLITNYPWPDIVEEKIKLWGPEVREMAEHIWASETEDQLEQRYKETTTTRSTFEPQARYAISRALNYARDRIQGIER